MPGYSAANPGAYNRRITLQQQLPVTTGVWDEQVTAWPAVLTTFAAFVAKGMASTAMGAQPMVWRQSEYTMRRVPSTPVLLGMRVIDTTGADAPQT
jgi:hypothetical protein